MISHHQKCIFIHIPKNAGQSIESVFLSLLNLTWETRAPLLLRPNDKPELGPPRLAHLKAHEYVKYKYLTQEMFDDYFKFAFVRNPWSRMVSIYKYYGPGRCDFKTFLLSHFKSTLLKDRYWLVGPQSEFIYDKKGNLLVDFVGRFENLQEDFNLVCEKAGIPLTQIPHVNDSKDNKSIYSIEPRRGMIREMLHCFLKKAPPPFKRYQDYYNQETIDYVAEIYKSDVELFGYDFE